MDIQIKWFDGQFNVILASALGKEPFLEIKGARIVDGQNGPFVSWPATKNASTGKWWSHVYASDAFNGVVLSKAQATMPAKAPARRQAASAGGGVDDDVPFNRAGAGRLFLAT
jgi:hypothetical protein